LWKVIFFCSFQMMSPILLVSLYLFNYIFNFPSSSDSKIHKYIVFICINYK
jgi:hypothetical protein